MRGNEPNAQLLWDETLDQWTVGISGSLQPILTDISSDLANYVQKAGDTMSGTLEIVDLSSPLKLEISGDAGVNKNFITMKQSGTVNIGDANRDQTLYELTDDTDNSVARVTYSSGQATEYARTDVFYWWRQWCVKPIGKGNYI